MKASVFHSSLPQRPVTSEIENLKTLKNLSVLQPLLKVKPKEFWNVCMPAISRHYPGVLITPKYDTDYIYFITWLWEYPNIDHLILFINCIANVFAISLSCPDNKETSFQNIKIIISLLLKRRLTVFLGWLSVDPCSTRPRVNAIWTLCLYSMQCMQKVWVSCTNWTANWTVCNVLYALQEQLGM